LIACILVLGPAWIAAIEKVSTANVGESWKNRAPKHGLKAVHSSTDHQWLVVA
jgi:hypothetical protein